MGINCKIHYTADGRVDFVEAPDGQRSELFDTLNDTFGEEKALDYFALTETETIKNKVAEKQNKYRKEKLSKLEEPKFSIIGEKGVSRVEEYNSKLNDAKELEKLTLPKFKSNADIGRIKTLDTRGNEDV